MSNTVIKVENLGKQYRLGTIGTGTISHDLNRWWARARGKEDPFLKIGDVNDRTKKGSSDLVWALKDINFEVKQGEVLGIIGKNGAGKSTLLKILSRVTGPSTGNVKVKGRIASLLEVGTGFHPELTGRENIFLNGAILGMTKQEIKSKFDEIVDFSGVERYIDTPVKRYSSGMYVRLAFAVAAHLEPEILIVDEVLAVGDAEFQKKCLGKMKDVSGQGRTVLFVSHNMAAVKSLCTQGLILQQGKLIYAGGSDDACSNYLSSSISKSNETLFTRSDRSGNGYLRATEIFFTDRNGKTLQQLISGEYVKLNIDFKKTISDVLTDFFIGIVVKNEHEVIQTFIASDELGEKFNVASETGRFEIEIDEILLRGGLYSINLTLSRKPSSASSHEIIDRVENALFFEVERGDYWKQGGLNRPAGYIQNATIKLV